MKTSSIAVETSRSTSQSDSIVRQTNKTFIPKSEITKLSVLSNKLSIRGIEIIGALQSSKVEEQYILVIVVRVEVL